MIPFSKRLRVRFGWARQGNSAVLHGAETLGFATGGILCRAGHCTEGEENIDFLESNNPTVRAGGKLFGGTPSTSIKDAHDGEPIHRLKRNMEQV